MKTLFPILFFTLVLLSTGAAVAQTETAMLNTAKMKDGYAMYQGSMIQIHNGQATPLTSDVTLKNGTRVQPNGTVTLPGKGKQKLQEGYAVNMNGKIVMLVYDMMRYDAIQEHSRNTLGNTETEVIVTNDGITLAGTGENKAAKNELLNRRMTLVNERNALIQQKADLLNKAKDRKAQQNSPAIKEVDAQISKIDQEMKELEAKLRSM